MSKRTSKVPGGWVTSAFDDFREADSQSVKSSVSSSQPRKRPRDEGSRSHVTESNRTHVTEGSRSHETEGSRSHVTPGSGSELWVDKYAPKTATDLAVHKKKVQEVQAWLETGLKHRSTRAPILLLTGPAGVGKTATVRALAADLSCAIHEWTNPVAAETLSMDDSQWRNCDWAVLRGESQAAQFADFLLRANRYQALQIFTSATDHFQETEQEPDGPKIVLLEDFPNAFLRDPSQFHVILRDYWRRGQCPLVIILSDSADVTERHLLPRDLQAKLGVVNISFNPVAPTSLQRVLAMVAAAEASQSGRSAPDKSELDQLAASCGGDLRAALNALQFSCRVSPKATMTLHKGKTSRSSVKVKGKMGRGMHVTSGEVTESHVTAVGGKDTALVLFRALGKILYCKRREPTAEDPQLPPHLAEHYRDPLIEIPEAVLEKCSLPGELFSAFLHENYPAFYTQIDDVIGASAYLSDADYLTNEWASRPALTDYSSALAARGLLFCNTARVRAGGGEGAGKGSGLGFRPLHKPQWLSVCKQARENITTAKDLFKGCGSPLEVQTQLIPFMSLIRPHATKAQQLFVAEVGRLHKSSRPRGPERLGEADDVTTDDPSLGDPLSVPLSRDNRDNLEGQQEVTPQELEEDEPVIIEDFED